MRTVCLTSIPQHHTSKVAVCCHRLLDDRRDGVLVVARPLLVGVGLLPQRIVSADLLRRYLTKRRDLQLPIEPALLDAYARQLPAQAFYRPAEVLFILESGPVVGSPAYQLSHLSQKLIDSLYKSVPLPRRIAFNNLIIKNTLAQAEATKDRTLAEKGAGFARGTWNGDYLKGQRTYERNMLNFYQAVKDTASYLRQAVPYYERYYLNLPVCVPDASNCL